MNDYLDERGFSKVDKIVDVYNFHPETKIFTCISPAPLIKNTGLPAHCTLVVPIENPKGVNRWDGEKWVDDEAYGKKLQIEDRKDKISILSSDLESQLTKLTLKQSVGRITEEEDQLRIKIINYLIDLDEFPVDDLEKELPVLLMD